MTEAQQSRPVALVTGASSGIGEAFVHLLAQEGRHVVIVARRESELNRIAGVTQSAHDVEVIPIALDLARRDAGKQLQNELAARKLYPDLLINNAGFGLSGSVADLSVDEQLSMVDVNVRALADVTMRFLPAMIERGNGGIINVASVASFVPGTYMATYHATKAFVLSWSEALHRETAGTGVTVTALCPGPVDTEFQGRAGLHGTRMMRIAKLQRAELVAQAGLIALRAGRRVVVPGMSNLIFAQMAQRVLPRRAMLAFFAFLQKPVGERRYRGKA